LAQSLPPGNPLEKRRRSRRPGDGWDTQAANSDTCAVGIPKNGGFNQKIVGKS